LEKKMEKNQHNSSNQSSVFSLQSAFHIAHSQGFTLIELLVAMGILMVIVLMMANLFQQSTRAWDAGMRQAEAGLEARAVVGMIQQELSQAVADSTMPFNASGGSLDFYTLGDVGTTNRIEPRRVQYSGGLSRNGSQILQGASFSVTPYYSVGSSPTSLPDVVEIEIGMTKESDYSTVRVESYGDPDWDSDDNRRLLLRTWRTKP
jgi:Tfp pilus assembly protein PilV